MSSSGVSDPAASPSDTSSPVRQDFIRQVVREDLASGKHTAIKTRSPPEPNGYLHIGHAKSICLNFGIARENNGRCNLRFDDTNPAKEHPEFVQAIQDDVRWLGFEWAELRHASDYFEVFYLAAEKLVREGHAYVDDLRQRYEDKLSAASLGDDEMVRLREALEAGLTGYTYLDSAPLD